MPSILRPRSPVPIKLESIKNKKTKSIENLKPNLDLNEIKLIVDGLDDFETTTNQSYGALKTTSNKPSVNSSAINDGFHSSE